MAKSSARRRALARAKWERQEQRRIEHDKLVKSRERIVVGVVVVAVVGILGGPRPASARRSDIRGRRAGARHDGHADPDGGAVSVPESGQEIPGAEVPSAEVPTAEVPTAEVPTQDEVTPVPVAPRPGPPPHAPRPVPGPPRAGRPSPAQAAPVAATGTPEDVPASAGAPASGDHAEFGRVDPSGTVYVRTADSEREIGTWQAGDPDGAVAFFGQRFDGIVAEVDLLEQRLRSGKLNPDEARSILRKHRSDWLSAHAMGDFVGLEARLAELDGLVDAQRAERSEARARVQSAAKEVKERLVAEAENLGRSNDWRSGVTRFRQLLDQWKAQPRLDRHTDDELWHRFSAARTAYTRRRKAHFAEASAKRDGAREVKERLVVQAEELAGSTEWGPTAAKLRTLMDEWRAAGGAPKDIDDELWATVPRCVRRLLRRSHGALLGPGLRVRGEPRREGGAADRGRSAPPGSGTGPCASHDAVGERALDRDRQGPAGLHEEHRGTSAGRREGDRRRRAAALAAHRPRAARPGRVDGDDAPRFGRQAQRSARRGQREG